MLEDADRNVQLNAIVGRAYSYSSPALAPAIKRVVLVMESVADKLAALRQR